MLVITAALWVVKTAAQVKCVIVDKETGTPIRDVKLIADDKLVATTNYQGILIADSIFSNASLIHPDYLTRVVEINELRDTLWMLPKAIRLGEVVVWGKYKPGITAIVESATEGLEAYAPPKGLASFDFFSMFRKKPLNRKARKKNKEILDNWDSMPNNVENPAEQQGVNSDNRENK